MKTAPARIFLIVIAAQIVVLLVLFIVPFKGSRQVNYSQKQQVLQRFSLSDYCLSTESRHTRHINFPEVIAPFQDLPGYHDHFPSSSFFKPQRQRLEIKPKK
ncbi:hypothetical protein BKI52_41630 [marine bacterium AO1-C]|nr:hypothetical protein BKI52_41630 [marine bacterium AO1-C]